MTIKTKSKANHPVTNFINEKVLEVINGENQYYKRFSNKTKYSQVLTFTFLSKYCNYKNEIIDDPKHDVYNQQEKFVFNIHKYIFNVFMELKEYKLIRHISIYLKQKDFSEKYQNFSIKIPNKFYDLYDDNPKMFLEIYKNERSR
jgi:hypothetical protein